MSKNVTSISRIYLIDTLRGFALLGILLLHAVEHFDLLYVPENIGWLKTCDSKVHDILFFVFSGKAYSIFAILFGLSFYIQMQNLSARGLNFYWKFSWRLAILLIMGYLLSLLYIGEILTVFALLGLFLLVLNLLPNKWLTIIAVLFLIQFPTLIILRLSFSESHFIFHQNWNAWANVFNTFSKGSFSDIVRFNAFNGHIAKWQFLYNAGRYLQLIGLFIIGLLLGRARYFENLTVFLPQTRKLALVSGVSFLLIYSSPFFIPSAFNVTQKELIALLSDSYRSFFFTGVLFTSFILLAVEWEWENKPTLLSNYGKMSLSNYILQPLIGVPFFYGFGLGMYQYFGATYSVLFGSGFFILQLLFSKIWLKHFYYGPFEWFWRALTLMNFKLPFKKI